MTKPLALKLYNMLNVNRVAPIFFSEIDAVTADDNNENIVSSSHISLLKAVTFNLANESIMSKQILMQRDDIPL